MLLAGPFEEKPGHRTHDRQAAQGAVAGRRGGDAECRSVSGGELGRGGVVVVKVAKPNQDMRFDVPTIGCTTIESMKQAGATVLAVEADKTIIIDEADTVALANRYGITIVARAA